jgi:ABC-type multidrug transport system fused ATPase/permease subunit
MLGLLPVSSGKILLGGMPIETLGRSTLSKIFAYVHQSIFILDGTIAQNIAFGVPDADINWDRVRRAIHLSHLESVIDDKADGWFTHVGERGGKLSGGQRQRLGIARGLYVVPKILVMDESTNALDGATESNIIDTLIELKREMSVIVVAHSKALISRCDRIIMFDRGRIVADGSFDELLAHSQVFSDFYSGARLTEL